ncbi:MAG: hypothetical protein M3Z46_11355 [Actinomycetota bacterium]|nr:hypothetical protein [Actinomycetota bacterium]
MHRTTKSGAAVTMTLAIAAGGLLAGCGSSSKTSSTATTAGAASSTTTAAATPAEATLVTAKKTDKLGTVLADKAGMTLYTLTKNGKAVACTGACPKAWPPYAAPAGVSKPEGSHGIAGLSTVAGSDGTRLVAVGGLPLYHFVQDKDGEDAYGDGIASFGGVWHVVKTTAVPTKGAAGGPEKTTTTGAPTTNDSGY